MTFIEALTQQVRRTSEEIVIEFSNRNWKYIQDFSNEASQAHNRIINESRLILNQYMSAASNENVIYCSRTATKISAADVIELDYNKEFSTLSKEHDDKMSELFNSLFRREFSNEKDLTDNG